MLFLLVFIIIVNSVLYGVILSSQERELQTLVSQEAKFIEDYLSKNNQTNLNEIQNQEFVFTGANQFFYYLISPNGEVLMGNEANPRIHQDLLRLVNGSIKYNREIQKETLQMNGHPMKRGNRGDFQPPNSEQDIHLLIASRQIYFKGQLIGQLYIGKDISFAYQLFRWVLIILIVLGIVFVGVAVIISRSMSKKAMIPISAAFRRQREFVGDASHELRTPLSVLLSSVEAMEMTLVTSKEDMTGKLLTNMREEVKRMTRLVSDLLTLARSDSNTIELKTEIFDLRILAEKTLDSLATLAAKKQIRFELNAPASLNAVGDPQRLSQLMYILLDNAIKYTPDAGKVQLNLYKEGQEVRIIVKDTGIGVRKEDYKRIFERFYRTDKSRSRQMGGHGLGLSIAKWIVETHNGTIDVTSEIGKGSTFTVRVPDNKGL